MYKIYIGDKVVMIAWEKLPPVFQNDSVKEYYISLKRKQWMLLIKRAFDSIVALVLLICLLPIFLILAICIKLDSRGPVFYRQERVTQYGKIFRIYKFRTMVNDADKKGSQVTLKGDSRITRVGKKIRKARLDELPQLLNVLCGDMSFVGTRPEVKKYVDCYTEEMYATLLLPAGITSEASIMFKDEDELLQNAENVDKQYVETVLPLKMKYNLESIKKINILKDFKKKFRTVIAVLQ